MQHLRGFDEVLKYVNELSGTIDLQSTLIRAEGLFKRFEKTVSAIDAKTSGLQGPSGEVGDTRRRSSLQAEGGGNGNSSADINRKGKQPVTVNQSSPAGASASGSGSGSGSDANRNQAGQTASKERIITPELRLLLSRKIVTLDESADVGARTRQSGLRD